MRLQLLRGAGIGPVVDELGRDFSEADHSLGTGAAVEALELFRNDLVPALDVAIERGFVVRKNDQRNLLRLLVFKRFSCEQVRQQSPKTLPPSLAVN